jgi:type VI protein secretion system component VasK
LIVDAFFKLIAAGPLFFVSAWLLMVFAGIVGEDVGIHPFGYVTAMVVTIGLWLTLAPAIGAVGRAPAKSKSKSKG